MNVEQEPHRRVRDEHGSSTWTLQKDTLKKRDPGSSPISGGEDILSVLDRQVFRARHVALQHSCRYQCRLVDPVISY